LVKAAKTALKDIMISRYLQKDGTLKKRQSVRLMLPHFRILVQLATPSQENISKKERAHQRNIASTKAGIKHGYSNISAFLHADKYETYSPKAIEKAAINLCKGILGKKKTKQIIKKYNNTYRPSLSDMISHKYDNSVGFH